MHAARPGEGRELYWWGLGVIRLKCPPSPPKNCVLCTVLDQSVHRTLVCFRGDSIFEFLPGGLPPQRGTLKTKTDDLTTDRQ